MNGKLLSLLLLAGLARATVLTQKADFISNKRHLIIYGDGIPKELLDTKQPVINSWREDMLEIRNMCKVIECNFLFQRATNYPNRFVSNKCYINNDHYCESNTEKNSVSTIEQIVHESDYASTITLGGRTYGIVANSKTEDALVFEIGSVSDDKSDDNKAARVLHDEAPPAELPRKAVKALRDELKQQV